MAVFRALALTTIVGMLAVAGGGAAGQAQGQSQQGQQQNQQQQGQQQPQQQGQQPDQSQPTFRTQINVVRVDAIVTDKNGNLITDLQPSDFEISEDNKPQKIDTFRLVKLDGGVKEAVKEPPREIHTDDDEADEASRDDVRLFAIFLDDYHVRTGASMAARDQLAKFVDTQLGPSDMIGVMYPLESTVSVRMTRNHSAVVKALQQFRGRKYDYQPMNEFEERYAYYPTETVERIRAEVSLSALRSLIVHMGGLKEGRKALIVVSEGYTYMVPPQMRNANAQMPGLGNPNAFNPNAGVNDPTEQRYAWMAGNDMDLDLREIFGTANKNNVALYMVDPRGLPGFEFDINENVGFQVDQQYLTATQDSLRVLAENTDGRAIVNRNDIAAGMQQITRDSSGYYLISYTSTQAPTDGKFHEIKVRVKRPGVQVRARKGYWAYTPEAAARATAPSKPAVPKPVESAIAAAVARPSKASVVRTWLGTTRGDNGKTKVTFVWEPIPRTPGDPVRGDAPARVALMALGNDGAPYYRGKVEPSAAKASGWVSFEAPPGKMQLRVSVEGESSDVLDTEMREVTVPDLTGTQPTLGTPSVFRARTQRDFVQLKAETDPVPVASREFSRTEHIFVRVSAYGPGGTAPTLQVHLLNRAGQSMSELSATPDSRPGEEQIEVPLAGLAPGEYVLEIKTGDQATQLVGFRVTG